MEWRNSWMWWLLLVLFVQFHVNGCFGCLDEERIALLDLKASFNYPNGSSFPSWNEGEESDCCAWERVMCSNITGRVTQLILNATRPWRIGYLNASLFLPFQELSNLDLSDNSIAGCFENQGFERLWRLRKLEVLNLNGNSFNNSILSSLNSLSSLKSLHLYKLELEGSFHIQVLSALSHLEELDLSNNQLDSFITIKGLGTMMSKLQVLDLRMNKFDISILQSLGEFSSLKKLNLRSNNLQGSVTVQELDKLRNLEVLDLCGNSLSNRFLQDLGIMPSLRVLSLCYNGLNGNLPVQGLCKLKRLQYLDLEGNHFEGSLPSCLSNLTSLGVLSLSGNQFGGNIASSPLTSLTSLEDLRLSYNHFQIPVSFSSFANLSKLEVLELDDNEFIEETESITSLPKFQLKYLHSSNCSFNKSLGAIPIFLVYQSKLRVVDLSNNNFEGNLPTWLLENNTQLEILVLKNNSFIGPFNLPSRPNIHTHTLELSDNLIHGQIPSNISVSFPNLRFLNMSRNALEGSIPSTLSDMRQLWFLDLADNYLSGRLIRVGSSLSFLKLSNNRLEGQIFSEMPDMTGLRFLYLDNNSFTGKIPDSLSSSSRLWILDISNNHVTGKLPQWIGNMSNLRALGLASNHLEGTIPVEFCSLSMLQFLDLSENKISGSLPSCFSPPFLQHVKLSGNELIGPLTHALSKIPFLETLDVGNNNLTGSIPNWIGELSNLQILVLTGNHFEGNIPIQLCQLYRLSIVDLSLNNLHGHIPFCLSNITFKTSDQYGYSESGSNGIFLPIYSKVDSAYLYQSTVLIDQFPNNPGLLPSHSPYFLSSKPVQVVFTTKLRSYSYKGKRLNFVSGIDLSCNQLTGEIPHEIGNLSEVHALNLSHNWLYGSIPSTFSNLKKIESLDLSHNKLNGTIPSQLIELNALAIFSVAHNNLSGHTPDRKAQFATFEGISYEGNPLLCGPPLKNNCNKTEAPSIHTERREDKEGLIDSYSFCLSFAISYMTVLSILIAVLYINPYWRRVWFYHIEMIFTNCYYYILDNLSKLSIHVN